MVKTPLMPGLHKPRLVRGQVRHTRLQPFVHAFDYRAFYLQLPLRSLAATTRQGLGWGLNCAALLSVHDRDHGDGRPLLEWATQTLKAASVHDADGEIWLQTFPRMLGYVFKPVSFWFCERADGSLAAVIAEVNNTFGDRHAYVLKAQGRSIHNGETLHADKAFYVSPFFKIQGSYRFRFFKSGLGGPDVARIEYRNQDNALLLTSMSGVSYPLTAGSAILSWLRYPFFSIGVIVRIHLQALILWWKGATFVSKKNALP
jgi:uncharacterized protein